MAIMGIVNPNFDTFWGGFTGTIGSFGIMCIDKT